MTSDTYEGIVYDLDGTLVRLDVDWDAVARDVAAVFDDAGVDVDGAGLWDMLTIADDHGLADEVEATIARHEREGARTSTRLRFSDRLADGAGDDPIAVCSLNCEEACRIALETHGLDEHVDTIVGRDSVATHKPDPEPLLAAVDALSVPAERALFVGDSPRDERTAERAGTAYRYVSEFDAD